ncbi:hypothetical protein [Anaerotignum sp.]
MGGIFTVFKSLQEQSETAVIQEMGTVLQKELLQKGKRESRL